MPWISIAQDCHQQHEWLVLHDLFCKKWLQLSMEVWFHHSHNDTMMTAMTTTTMTTIAATTTAMSWIVHGTFSTWPTPKDDKGTLTTVSPMDGSMASWGGVSLPRMVTIKTEKTTTVMTTMSKTTPSTFSAWPKPDNDKGTSKTICPGMAMWHGVEALNGGFCGGQWWFYSLTSWMASPCVWHLLQ